MIKKYEGMVTYLLERLAPVLFETKSSFLLGLNLHECEKAGTDHRISHQNAEWFCKTLGLKHHVLAQHENCAQILFYKPSVLIPHLMVNVVNREFLDSYDYDGLDFTQHLERLESRFNCGNFPHEIGLFLGYPLKDVLGYIENGFKNETYCGPWKVYGCPKDSICLMKKHAACRRAVKGLLERYSLAVCLEKVNRA